MLGIGLSLPQSIVGRGLVQQPPDGTSASPSFDFSAGEMPAGATLKRASPGYRRNPAGLLVLEGVDIPRFDFAPGGALRGLMMERPSTNLLLGASDYAAGDWAKTRSTVTTDAGTAPDGNVGADRLAGNGASGFMRQSNPPGVSAGQVLTFSIYVLLESAADAIASNLYGSGASVRHSTAGAGSDVQGFRRIVATSTASSASGFVQFGIDLAGTSVLAWNAQLEAGAGATSPIGTSNAQASRAEDVLTLDLAGRGVANGPATLRVTSENAQVQDIPVAVADGKVVIGGAAITAPSLLRAELV